MIAQVASKNPELSVIIVIVTDTKHLEGCLIALRQQINPPVMEIIVPYNSHDDDISLLIKEFPSVRFHSVDIIQSSIDGPGLRHAHLDEFRAKGLELARGEIVALLEDHDRPDKYWAMHVMEAHKKPYAVIGGAIENEIDRALNWAVYFCDFGRYQNPVKSGPSPHLSDVNISYKRQVLDRISEVWQGFYHEPTVNNTLIAQGETLWLSPQIVVYQHRKNLKLGAIIRERYDWGRYYAGNRVEKFSLINRITYIALAPILPILLSARKFRDVISKKRLIGVFIRAFPLTLLLTFFWSIGEFVGYVTASPIKSLPKN